MEAQKLKTGLCRGYILMREVGQQGKMKVEWRSTGPREVLMGNKKMEMRR